MPLTKFPPHPSYIVKVDYQSQDTDIGTALQEYYNTQVLQALFRFLQSLQLFSLKAIDFLLEVIALLAIFFFERLSHNVVIFYFFIHPYVYF